MMTEPQGPTDFVRQIVAEDVRAGRNGGKVVTRFPPEPNGYLHIGHAKSICLNFGIAAEQQGGTCYLRFDDTNPSRESPEYVQAIEDDVRWLGFDWGQHRTHASDYFEQLAEFAVRLIEQGKAYVDSLSADEIREYRGTLTQAGQDSPCRNRTVAENLDLFARMRAGEYPDGAHVLRAKIDMAAPNLNLRDPVMYRIMHREHQNTGSNWCIYPTYDFAHGQCDYLDGVTHSVCTLEFEDHRALYDWYVEALELEPPPRQYEFSRLNLTNTVMSKRFLNQLVTEAVVSGWDDPRMPTLRGMRRRGFTAAAIRDFCGRIGVTKKDNTIEMALLETCVREDLDRSAPRALAVVNPLKVVVTNYPEDQEEWLEAVNHPRDEEMGRRQVPFSRVIYVERDDFMEDPPRKFFRLSPGREVRLRFAYLVTCTGVVKDPVTGEVIEIHCEYDSASRGGNAADGRKVKGTIHWVSAAHALKSEVRLYQPLFSEAHPSNKQAERIDQINPESLQVLPEVLVEPGLARAQAGTTYQFERLGYFTVDSRDSRSGALVFNRTVTLRDTWAKKK